MAMDAHRARIEDLSLCLGEHLQLAGCSNLHAVLALLVALGHACDSLPEGSQETRRIVSELLFLGPPTRTDDEPSEV